MRLSKEELQSREDKFEQVYGEKASDTYRDMKDELQHVSGGWRSISFWASDYLEAGTQEDQLEMFLTDYFPFLEKNGFPPYRTPIQQDALHELKMAAGQFKTVFGQKDVPEPFAEKKKAPRP